MRKRKGVAATVVVVPELEPLTVLSQLIFVRSDVIGRFAEMLSFDWGSQQASCLISQQSYDSKSWPSPH